MTTLRVFNNNQHPKILRSADGDSVIVQAKTTTDIDDKFDWQIPPGIRVIERIGPPVDQNQAFEAIRQSNQGGIGADGLTHKPNEIAAADVVTPTVDQPFTPLEREAERNSNASDTGANRHPRRGRGNVGVGNSE